MSKYFCIMPFKSLEVSPDSTCQVCCKINKVIQRDDGGKYSVVESSLDEIWNSQDLKTLREKFQRGEKPEECQKCWTEEDAGVSSLRMQNQHDEGVDLENPKIKYISLKLSNKCNLACRICSPYLSTLWVTQFKKANIPTFLPSGFDQPIKFEGDRLETLHKISEGLDTIAVYGGEPLVNDEALAYLTFLSDSGLSKNIHLTLNTNGTVHTDELVDKLSKFKKVSLFLSIDDIGTRFEYQRWPAKWAKVEENVKKYCEQRTQAFDTAFFPTLSILNIIHLEEILDTLNGYNVPITLFNLIHQPEILCLKNLPPALKEKIIEIIEKIDFSNYTFRHPESGHKDFIINFIKLPPDENFVFHSVEDYSKAMNEYLHRHDVLRSTMLEDYLPGLYKLIQDNK